MSSAGNAIEQDDDGAATIVNVEMFTQVLYAILFVLLLVLLYAMIKLIKFAFEPCYKILILNNNHSNTINDESKEMFYLDEKQNPKVKRLFFPLTPPTTNNNIALVYLFQDVSIHF